MRGVTVALHVVEFVAAMRIGWAVLTFAGASIAARCRRA